MISFKRYSGNTLYSVKQYLLTCYEEGRQPVVGSFQPILAKLVDILVIVQCVFLYCSISPPSH